MYWTTTILTDCAMYAVDGPYVNTCQSTIETPVGSVVVNNAIVLQFSISLEPPGKQTEIDITVQRPSPHQMHIPTLHMY